MRAPEICPLSIITPPFGIGLGLIFGRSGLVNQWINTLFGIEPDRWIYGFTGVWLAQVFSFTPTALLVPLCVVKGISPTMEAASQTLRASRMRPFTAGTLPLMRPGLANAWLVVFVATFMGEVDHVKGTLEATGAIAPEAHALLRVGEKVDVVLADRGVVAVKA